MPPVVHLDHSHIKKMMSLFVSTAKNDFQLTITDDEKKQMVRKVIMHYLNHANEYTVRVNSTDPFKFLAWAGSILFNDIKKESTKREVYLAIAVATMLHLLQENDKNLSIEFVQKLLIMAKHDESAKDHLAIGKNGLYMAFRSASEAR